MSKRDIKEYTKSYLSMPFLKENVKYRRECVLEQISKYEHKNILEIGCGMFPLFEHLENDFDHYLIVEPSAVFAEHAREKASHLSNVEILEGFFEEQYSNLLDKKFDFIICSSLLHEVQDDKKLLLAIREAANENTLIHINVPNALSMHRLIAKEMGLIEHLYQKSENQKELQQRDVYDIQTLERVMEESGFNVIDKGSFFIKPFTHSQMDKMLKSEIINHEVIAGLQKIIKYFPDYGSEIFVNVRKS